MSVTNMANVLEFGVMKVICTTHYMLSLKSLWTWFGLLICIVF